jgi:hypothetical protein
MLTLAAEKPSGTISWRQPAPTTSRCAGEVQGRPLNLDAWSPAYKLEQSTTHKDMLKAATSARIR